MESCRYSELLDSKSNWTIAKPLLKLLSDILCINMKVRKLKKLNTCTVLTVNWCDEETENFGEWSMRRGSMAPKELAREVSGKTDIESFVILSLFIASSVLFLGLGGRGGGGPLAEIKDMNYF